MAALPAGNFCDRRFLSRYAKRFSRSHAETKVCGRWLIAAWHDFCICTLMERRQLV
jgi:hypothetical protein